jgi:membrane protein YqaA with SNARE-associated domain
MITGHLIATLLPLAVRSMWRWLFHFGGTGLIPVGVVDSSLLPLPGILDVATVALSARGEQVWLYYALMATAGSLAGGFLTYQIARKGGKEALERRLSPGKVDKVCETFGRWGFIAIALPAFLPPPVPMVPFLLVAGAMQYPARKFLAALAFGRISRYLVLAYLAARYGREIIAFIAEHGHPAAVATMLAVTAAVTAVFYFWRGSKNTKRASDMAAIYSEQSIH